MSDNIEKPEKEEVQQDNNDEIVFHLPNEFNPDLDFLGSFSGYTSDTENSDDTNYETFLCSSFNHTQIFSPDRISMLRSSDKKKYGYFIYPQEKAYRLLTYLCESPRLNQEVQSFFILPQHPTRIYFEVDSYGFIDKYHPCMQIIKVSFDEFLTEIMHMWLSKIMRHTFSEFGRLHIAPYLNDPCHILDIDLKKKVALVRIIPRLNLSNFGYTIDNPKLFDPKLFEEKGIKLKQVEKKIVFSNYQKVMCDAFHGMYFTGGCLLTKVKLANIEYPADVNVQERKMFKNKMLLSYSKDPEDSIDWNDHRFYKIIKNVKDRNETEQSRMNIKFSKKPPREQALITVEEKHKILSQINKEKQQKMSYFETYTPPPVVYERKPVHMEIHTVNFFDTLPQSEELDKDIDEISLEKIPLDLREQIKAREAHKPGFLVELPQGTVGIILSVDDEKSVILQMDGNITDVPPSAVLIRLNDDGTVKDQKGKRVLPDDTVEIVAGNGTNLIGTVLHTYNNRIFGSFSDPCSLYEEKILCVSSKQIKLVADDQGIVEE